MRCTHRVTSVVGHVFSTDFPAQYQNWNSTDPVDLFGAPVVRKPTKQAVVKHLEREARARMSWCCGSTATARARTFASR